MKLGAPRKADLIKMRDVPDEIKDLTGLVRKRAVIYSWCTKGRKHKLGGKVKLKYSNRSGTWYTTKEWIIDFIRKVG
jgi:hypothetical protein